MNSKADPLVSVIVPVYNVESYLGQCLGSIINQTYENLEIICVNDGTRDGSEKIIDRYAEKDSRIKKINQKNAGLNKARSSGFKESTGDYVTFVDSDDAIHSKTIEVALRNILETGSDIAVFGCKEFTQSIPENETEVTLQHKVLTGKEEIFRYLLVKDPEFPGHTFQLSVWGKLYKRSIITSIDWDKSNHRAHEDYFWTPYALNSVKNSICLNRSDFYFYRRDPSRDVLSKVATGNTFNGKPIGFLELVHDYSLLVDRLLVTNHLKDMLARELQDAVYAMYRSHMGIIAETDMVGSENNAQYVPEYYQYSERRISNLIETINKQDNHIKSQDDHIHSIESKRNELEDKLNPRTASFTYLIGIMLRVLKYKVLRIGAKN